MTLARKTHLRETSAFFFHKTVSFIFNYMCIYIYTNVFFSAQKRDDAEFKRFTDAVDLNERVNVRHFKKILRW